MVSSAYQYLLCHYTSYISVTLQVSSAKQFHCAPNIMDTYSTSCAITWSLSLQHIPTLTHRLIHQYTNTSTLYFYTSSKNFITYATPISGWSQVDWPLWKFTCQRWILTVLILDTCIAFIRWCTCSYYDFIYSFQSFTISRKWRTLAVMHILRTSTLLNKWYYK